MNPGVREYALVKVIEQFRSEVNGYEPFTDE